MAINLLADNRTLTSDAKYSYLNDNYASGVSTVQIANTDGFSADSIVLIGEIGDESSEFFRIGTVNTSTGDLTLQTVAGVGTATKFSHPESSRVTVLPFDQIRFYWTAALGTIADETPTFATTTPLTGWTAITPAEWYSTYSDADHSTGFGWFVYRNSITSVSSQTSNPIPYAGFSLNTVANVFADFDSLLNVRELKLISLPEKFSWLNEALALLKNKLNLSNVEYTVSTRQTLSIVSSTAEYQLPDDFTDIVEITDDLNSTTSVGYPIPFMPVSKALSYTGDVTHYYLRGRYIGFVPTPDATETYYYRYRAKASRLTSLSDYIDLPDNAFYALKDFMLYRANSKFGNQGVASTYYQSFSNGVNLFIQSAVKRSANLDSWSVDNSANV